MLRSKLFDGLKRISTPFRTRNPHRDGARGRRDFRRPGLECLERRELLSVAGWVTSATSPNIGATETAPDLEGNVYVAGSFLEIADFAPGVTIPGDPDILINNSGGWEVFVAKYRPDGSLDWVRGLGSDPSAFYSHIAVEPVGDEMVADNIYIVVDEGDAWKLNGDDGSTIRWDDDNSSLELADINVYPATGDIYVTGTFSGTITTNNTVSGEPITVSSEGWDDVYVAKANSDGLVYWVQHDGGRRSSSGGDSITVDDSGDVYVTGNLNDKKGADTRGQSDVFVWKLDSTDGSFVWTQRAGGDSNHVAKHGDAGYEITVDNSGGVYVTGALGPSGNPADFGDFQIDLPSEAVTRYGFVTKLDDATGDFLWATRFGGEQADDRTVGGSVDLDSTGKLHLGGIAKRAGTFGAFNLPDPSGPSQGFWATMNAGTGEFESVIRVGTTTDEGDDILEFDSNDNLFMAGFLRGLDQEFLTGDILSSSLDENGNPTFDMVLVKIFADDPTNNPPENVSAGGPYEERTEDVEIVLNASAWDPDGDPLSYTWDFGDGTTAITTSTTINHTYEWGDTFAVSVTVSDGRGGMATAATTALVAEENDVPVAGPGGPYAGSEGVAVTFDASASTDFDNQDGTAANDQTLTYLWDFGDDNTVSTTSPTVDHAYAAVGTYDVSLTVNDTLVDSAVAMTTATVSPVGQPEVYDSTDTPLAIADAHPKKGPKTTTSELVIVSNDTVGSLDLVISLDDGSSDVTDLTATLTSPDGTTVSVTLASGTTTYYAVFGFAGDSLGGTWTLAITDSVKGNTHTLNSWSLTVVPIPAGGASSSALLAADELFASDGPAVDVADLLVDDRLFPTTAKKHGKRSAVDLVLSDITAGPFDERLAEELAVALV